MDLLPVLESIARLLPQLPAQSIEDQLVTFDSLLNVTPPEQRPAAAQLLTDAANTATDPARQDRILQAAAAVLAGSPCAFTPDGLSAAQAAAAQTVTQEEWDARLAQNPLPGESNAGVSVAGQDDDEDEDEQDDEESEDDDFMESPPPPLSHLPVRHFFPGLLVRVDRAFTDAQGRTLCTGDLLKLISLEQNKSGYLLNLIVRTVRLNPADHAEIIENAGNAWFQPVPSIECLEDLCEGLNDALDLAEEDEEFDDEELLEEVRADLETCSEWLSRSGDRGEPPRSESASAAAELFGRDHQITVWSHFLFAAVGQALPSAQTP